jgi:hypothetical protein
MIINGAVITAVMFGEMAVLMTSMNRKSSKFQKLLDKANTTMKNMKLPELLQLGIIDYLIYTRATLDHKSEYKRFETMLSPSLLTEVNYELYD